MHTHYPTFLKIHHNIQNEDRLSTAAHPSNYLKLYSTHTYTYVYNICMYIYCMCCTYSISNVSTYVYIQYIYVCNFACYVLYASTFAGLNLSRISSHHRKVSSLANLDQAGNTCVIMSQAA